MTACATEKRSEDKFHFVRAKGSQLVLAVLLALVCAQAFALHTYVPTQQARRAARRKAHLRRARWNPVFRPSRDSLLRQNEEIDRLDLPRIQDDNELRQLIASQDLV